MNLSELRDRHKGETIWVLGSGATLNHVDPSFFNDKIVIATNLAAEGMGVDADYVHSHYHENIDSQAVKTFGPQYVTPMGDKGFAGTPSRRTDGVIYYDHEATGVFETTGAWHPDGLLVGASSMHGSMHLGAFMGAATLILCGADCGLLDGESNYSAYVDEYGRTKSGDLLTNDAMHWLARWEAQLRFTKNALVERYGVQIYSLNPFINLNLEGHVFTGVTV